MNVFLQCDFVTSLLSRTPVFPKEEKTKKRSAQPTKSPARKRTRKEESVAEEHLEDHIPDASLDSRPKVIAKLEFFCIILL